MTEDEYIKKYAREFMHSTRNNLLSYEYGRICTSCWFTVMKWKNELQKQNEKNINRSLNMLKKKDTMYLFRRK